MIKKNAYLCSLILLCLGLTVSCDKDFQDIGTTIINNNVFDTKELVLDVEITPKNIESVRADNIALGNLGAYLFGIYQKGKSNNVKTEASIISQLALPSQLKVVDKTYLADTTVVTIIDDVVLKIPLQVTSKGKASSGKSIFRIDSLLGNANDNFTVEVYQSNTFLNRLDPSNPSKNNSFQSNESYEKIGTLLNANMDTDFSFANAAGDTVYYFNRHLSDGREFKDSIKIVNGSIKANPFKTIRLDKNRFKTAFLDKYTSDDFASQEALNNYFRGVIIEASGASGAMVPLDFSKAALSPSIDIIYTNTILKGGTIIDTISKKDSFVFSGIKNSLYKTTAASTNIANTFILHGTSGSMANIKLFGDDLDNNGVADKIEELRKQSLLVNDASLTFYISQNSSLDTLKTPKRLFLYKNGVTRNDAGELVSTPSQISDLLNEGPNSFGGTLELSSQKPDRYRFRITDYVSDLLDGTSNYLPELGLRVFNTTDIPRTRDTIVRSYNWNARSVPLQDNSTVNGARKAKLKITYTVKK
ncbi:DUF4270 family protein [Tenacibaculum maritimum]|uniref:DUF4270 family protein n=1 Tax=Tenacibaculum maritimum TaxID=107401 RepID=UPI0012E52979|nr:DUF4270 family protein [Tenacibaculum maritimum]CAA0222679.1 conserved exported hypothetical protein [Tenacibaculum maritimum]